MRCKYITEFPDVTNTYVYVWSTVKRDLLFYEAFLQYPEKSLHKLVNICRL